MRLVEGKPSEEASLRLTNHVTTSWVQPAASVRISADFPGRGGRFNCTNA